MRQATSTLRTAVQADCPSLLDKTGIYKSYSFDSLGCPPPHWRPGRLHNEVEVSMALINRAARARRRPRASWARAASAAGVIALAAAVAACGNGNSSGASSGGTKDGFKQAA